MNWSAEQQRLLGEMGYELMVRASVVANATNFPALQQALRRAAGDRDVSGLIDDLERLRREPALKRELWPKLRALRRSH